MCHAYIDTLLPQGRIHVVYVIAVMELLILSIQANIQSHLCLLSTAVNCGTLANPANGQVSHTAGTFGRTSTYICNTGYNLVGGSTRTCQATGVWSGSAPTCQGISLYMYMHVRSKGKT